MARKRKWRGPAAILLAACIWQATRMLGPVPIHEKPILALGFFALLIIYAVLFVLAELLKPKPNLENQKPSGLGDFNFPTATESRSVPLIWGTVMCQGPNVIWYGNLTQKAIKEKVKTGLWSSEHVTVGFQYFVGIQFGLCRGQVDSLRSVYIGDTLVYNTPVTTDSSFVIDKPSLFGGDNLGNGGVVGTVSFYRGSITQAVDPYLQGFQDSGVGTTRTPRYSGTSHCVFQHGYIGNSTSIKPWKFELRRIPNGLGLGTPTVNASNDANPMNVIYEILTNTEWGFAFPAGDIDTANFTAAAATLLAENNGFSMLLDRVTEAAELLEILQNQIDGVIFMDHRSGKYKVKLARSDYDVNLIPEITKATNIVSIENFTRGAWEDTANQVRIVYNDRAMAYTERTAFAQDTANALLQGGGTVLTGTNVAITVNYPGVKDAALAAQIASRELRSSSYPLAKGRFTVTRALWGLSPGDVVAFTDPELGIVKLPMRVVRIGYGNLVNGQISLDAVQDVFQFQSAAFGTPAGTLWIGPTDTLAPFVYTSIFEAPRAFLTRDPLFTGVYGDRVWAGAAQLGNEVGFKIDTRISPAAFVETGDISGTFFRGALAATLLRGAGTGNSFSVTMASTQDQVDLLAAFTPGATALDIGQNLVHLIQIDTEFFLVTSAIAGTGLNVDLSGVYRGVLDSVQGDHAPAASVFFLFVSGGLEDQDLVAGSTYDVKLLPYSAYDQVLESAVTATVVPMVNRLRNPYPPSQLKLNTVADDTTNVSLEGTGSGDTTGILLDLTRRDYRTADEVVALTVDAAVLFADFPTLNTYEHQIEVRNDPAGANTLLYTVAYTNAASLTLFRNLILKGTDGVIPTTLGLVITSRHTYETVQRTSTFNKTWAFTVATALSGQFNFGALDTNEVSNLYTATVNGTYNFTIATALATGNVEYRLNAGAFTTLISTGNTTGNIPGVVATDTIEIRHTSSTSGTLTFLAMDAPGAGQDGYGILFKP